MNQFNCSQSLVDRQQTTDRFSKLIRWTGSSPTGKLVNKYTVQSISWIKRFFDGSQPNLRSLFLLLRGGPAVIFPKYK